MQTPLLKLAQLSAEEREFLCGPVVADETFASGLATRLAALLSARTRQQVEVQAVVASGPLAADGSDPKLVWDGVLDELWLCGRLGGKPGVATSLALRARLQRTLQLALAEAWLSHTAPCLPALLSFDIVSNARRARLDIRFPTNEMTMKLWALHTIRHAQ